jgi:hypothetical protein
MQTGRILAVDLRAHRFGYAIFELPHQLLDCGIPTFDSSYILAVRLQVLIKLFRPSVIVLDPGARRGLRKKEWRALLITSIRQRASKLGVSVTVVPASVLRNFLKSLGTRNKYRLARLLIGWFPQLSRPTPTARKSYEPERWMMARFDAVGLGVAYLLRNNESAANFFAGTSTVNCSTKELRAFSSASQ